MKLRKRQVKCELGWFSSMKPKAMGSVTGFWEIASVRRLATIGRSCSIMMNLKKKYSAGGKLREMIFSFPAGDGGIDPILVMVPISDRSGNAQCAALKQSP